MANRQALPLPLTLEEIDRDWLTAALRTRAPGVCVEAFEIVDVKRGTCTKVRLRLEMDAAGRSAGIPPTVILKGGFEPHSREMHFMHETEVRGYRDLFPVLKLPSPACYFADYDAQRRQGVILMEDLVARGVAFCNPLRPERFEAVARRLRVLARFHAKTWNSPEFAPGGRWDWVAELMPANRAYASQYLEPDTWRRFIDSPRGAAASVRFHDPAWMTHALDRLVLLSGRRPSCIQHGDTHLGNLYVDTDGTPGFFDSLPHRGPAAGEVSYHIACALDPADRRRWEGPLVALYLDELARNGVEPPDFDEVMSDYGACLARAYFTFVVNDAVFQSEAVNTAYVARISAAMLDHDAIGLLDAIS
ncbi:phosphotransferase [Phenylobacterium sp. LjRoot225]|uniref:phosphotransferase n=1 Tax=Phenylobacterium sp. LjRoot225 TaxID=3342285 RepID=UPI003ECDF151